MYEVLFPARMIKPTVLCKSAYDRCVTAATVTSKTADCNETLRAKVQISANVGQSVSYCVPAKLQMKFTLNPPLPLHQTAAAAATALLFSDTLANNSGVENGAKRRRGECGPDRDNSARRPQW